jgi:hypothetical protein
MEFFSPDHVAQSRTIGVICSDVEVFCADVSEISFLIEEVLT